MKLFQFTIVVYCCLLNQEEYNYWRQYVDNDTLVAPDFVHFEHTNGNNYLMISAVRKIFMIAGNASPDAQAKACRQKLVKRNSRELPATNFGRYREICYFYNSMEKQPNNPLHGKTLEQILQHLLDHFGWEELGQRITIRCFNENPSIQSSLKFLRKTPWARTKVEELYIQILS